MTAVRSFLLLVGITGSAALAAAAPTVTGLAGGAIPLARDGDGLRAGSAFEVRVAPTGACAFEPFARLHWERLTPRAAVGDPLALPTPSTPARGLERVERTAFELGLARRFDVGALHCAIHGSAGADWVHPVTLPSAIRNDRRPDPAATPAARGGGFGASLALGLDVRAPLGRQFAFDASAELQGSAVNGMVHPPLALLAGLAWPARATPPGGEHAWAMRVGAGPAWWIAPGDDARRSRLGHAVTVSVARPYDEHVAFELAGTWAAISSRDPKLLRQERDAFGNLVDVYAEDHATWTLVTAVPCARAVVALGGWHTALRGGVGLGHTGGEGATESVPLLDLETLQTILVEQRAGFGRPAAGVAWEAGFALARDLPAHAALFVEADAWGTSTKYANVTLASLSAGIELH